MANELGLNIQYPYDIKWVPDEGKPIGLFAIAGWVEDRILEIEEERRRADLKARGFTEIHESDLDNDYNKYMEGDSQEWQ